MGLRYLFIGLGLLGTGCYITFKSDRHTVRAKMQQEYELSVHQWEQSERHRFASTTWSIRQ
eukprot:scaffold242121_cov53-Prasinocladus_malaysianus.AAC.1